jgi:hypothetical protein
MFCSAESLQRLASGQKVLTRQTRCVFMDLRRVAVHQKIFERKSARPMGMKQGFTGISLELWHADPDEIIVSLIFTISKRL